MEVGQSFNPYGVFVGSIIPNVVMRNRDLPPSAKLCYGRLLQYSGKNGRCFPSLETLGTEIGLERRQVIRVIHILENYGLIKTNEVARKDGGDTTSNYLFLWHRMFEGDYEEGSVVQDTGGSVMHDTGGSVVQDTHNKYQLLSGSVTNALPDGSAWSGPPGGGPDQSKPRVKPILFKRKQNPIETPRYRPDVLKVINYWNSSPGLQHLTVPTNGKRPTKSFTRTTRIIAMVINGSYMWPPSVKFPNPGPCTVERIITTIDRFKLAATNINYHPTNKNWIKRIGLGAFFYSEYLTDNQSKFLQYLNDEPIPVTSYVPKLQENNPQMTKWLKELYIEKVLLGQPKEFTQLEENKFIKGANQLVQTMANFRKRLNLLTGPREWCEYVINALVDHSHRGNRPVPVRVGSVCSAWTYNDLLPEYLKTVGRMD